MDNQTVFAILFFVILPIVMATLYVISRCRHVDLVLGSKSYTMEQDISPSEASRVHYVSVPFTSYHCRCSKCGRIKYYRVQG